MKNVTPWHNDRAFGFGLGVSIIKDPAYMDNLFSIGTFGLNGYTHRDPIVFRLSQQIEWR